MKVEPRTITGEGGVKGIVNVPEFEILTCLKSRREPNDTRADMFVISSSSGFGTREAMVGFNQSGKSFNDGIATGPVVFQYHPGEVFFF